MRKLLFLSGLSFLLFAGCTTVPQVETITAYRSFEIPASSSPDRLIDPVKDSLAVRASNLGVTAGIVPEVLPERAGTFETTLQQMNLPFGKSFTFPTVKCKDAFAVITNTGGYGGGGSSQSDNYTACIYPSQSGTKVHFVLVSTTTHSGGISGMVNSAIKDTMVGGSKEAAERSLDKISTKFTGIIPGAKVIRSSNQ